MRVLFLALEPPYPPNDGGRIRTFQLLRQLGRQCEITLLAFESAKEPEADWSPLREICREVHVLTRPAVGPSSAGQRLRLLSQRLPQAIRLYDSGPMADLLQASLAGGCYDILQVNELYLARYASLARQTPRVMDHTDVEARKQRRLLLADPQRYTPYWWLRWVEHWQWQALERRSLSWFDAHSAVSDGDAGYFRRHARGASVLVVPNGVDAASISPRPDPAGPPTLLYVGSMDYQPNAEAVLDFARHAWPSIRQAAPDVRLLVVGRNPPPEVRRLAGEPGIVVTGTVPDIQPYYRQAHALVVPLRTGGGTRLKILEALAAGVPVLSTAVGAEGLALIPGRDFLLAETPQDFAAQTVRLLADPDLRAALAARGRQTVTARYDWGAIGDRLLEVYEMAIARRQGIRNATKLAEGAA